MDKPVVLITGGLTGIGRAAAVAFAKKGAKVVVTGRRDEAGKALVKELRSFGSEAEFINADVRKEDDVRTLVDKTVARFGRLDVAVNNAATEGAVGPITVPTAESFAATFETNVLGVVLSMKHEVRVMQRQGSGSIINISSTYGHEGAAFASIYVGAKHAVEGITKSVALEIAKSGIRVNAVAPGPTDTGMLTRFTGTAENKAALATQVPWVDSAYPRKSPTVSSSWDRTQPNSSRGTSSTSTAVTVRTDPVRATGIARGSRLLRPTPDQRTIHIKWKEEVQWLT
jgi:NAD(P)-dependent dehydrogenase (short-subunit alcohol dehydrogenase family)